MAKTRAQQNRQIRQEATREHLRALGLIQHVVDIAEKLAEPDELDSTKIAALKASADIRMRLVDKYLPNLQSVESYNETTLHRAGDLTDEELAYIAAGGSGGTAETAESSDNVH